MRARNQVTITGPIPRMLDSALDWARRTFDTTIFANPDGTVTDRPEYPLVAFREIIANALILVGLSQFWLQAIYCLVILLAVSADALILRRLHRATVARRAR